jgi:hypothetical protein
LTLASDSQPTLAFYGLKVTLLKILTLIPDQGASVEQAPFNRMSLAAPEEMSRSNNSVSCQQLRSNCPECWVSERIQLRPIDMPAGYPILAPTR